MNAIRRYPQPLLSLTDPACQDVAVAGGKAATLASLFAEGLPIPPGFAVPADVALDADTLARALDALGGRPVAVRSSGVQEDGAVASLAGRYLSLLDVEGVAAVQAAIADVRASGGPDEVLPVLVQRMVPADVAGVAFSANPVTGARDEAVVSAAPRLADRLVAGEEDGNSWLLGPKGLQRTGGDDGIDEGIVRAAAALARRLEGLRGAPQDIEWAAVAGQVFLVQSRPITALPRRPEIEVPPEGEIWEKDIAHFSGPLTPFGASVLEGLFEPATRAMCDRWGLMVETVECKAIGGELYSHVVPFGGGKEDAAAPPWWVLGVVSRLMPSIRKRLALGAEAIARGELDSIPRAWEESGRAESLAAVRALQEVDPEALDDAALVAHIRQIHALQTRGQEIHFELFVPYLVGVRGLVTTCEELLTWDATQAMRLLQGMSPTSSAPTRELQELGRYLAGRDGVLDLLREGASGLEQLPNHDPAAAARVDAWRARWGIRCLDYDPGAPSLNERPDLVAGLLRDAASQSLSTGASQRDELVAKTRAGLSGDALARFDQALARAELVYPQREDNLFVLDSLPSGLLRLAALEVGRRLVARGQLAVATDMVWLELDDLLAALADGRSRRVEAAQRCAESKWVAANPGPLRYGPKPAPPPNVRGLRESARRLNGAILWAMEQELTTPDAPADGALGGVGVSPGRYEGRVRVLRSPDELERLLAGEVLVCPITNPAWSFVFGRAGALITDGGSVLSHAAIVAREHHLPAVVATTNATEQLRDGDLVRVDGARGTVEVLERAGE